MTRFPLLDERCSECGHRIGVHYAASNAGEAFGTWCSESGCVCGTDPNVDHWTVIPGNSDTQRYKQLGNAVAVPVAEWILGNIVKAAP